MKRISLLFLALCAYAHAISYHVFEADPEEHRILPVHALDNGIGRETVSSIAYRHGAIAAVNGGFWDENGVPKGILKINGEWYATPYKRRGAILWNDNGEATIDRPFATCSVVIGSAEWEIAGINHERKDEIVVYLPTFHRTTLTGPEGTEIIVIDGNIAEIVRGGSSPIPHNGYVISVPSRDENWTSLAVGTPVDLNIPLPDAQHIVGGAVILLQNGEIADLYEEPFVGSFAMPHARTAVGTKPDGTWLFIVVETEVTLEELASLMLYLGCVQALNLDGGGSSTMVINHELVNTPSSWEERLVSDAILVLPRTQSAPRI